MQRKVKVPSAHRIHEVAPNCDCSEVLAHITQSDHYHRDECWIVTECGGKTRAAGWRCDRGGMARCILEGCTDKTAGELV